MENIVDNVIDLQNAVEEANENRKEQLTNIDFKMVTFSLSGKDYAIDIMSVKEIAKAGRFTYVPNTSPYVLGVHNLRGDIIPIIDLRLFFNMEVPEKKSNELESLIIVSVGDQSYGVVIDAIDKVVGIQKSTIQPPHPLFGDISIKYISGVVESNDRLYILLDVERIFGVRKEAHSSSENSDDAKLALVRPAQIINVPKTIENDIPLSVKTKAAGPKETTIEENKSGEEYKFIVDSLSKIKRFNTSEINEAWVKKQVDLWIKERGSKYQIIDEKDGIEFLKSFYSPDTEKFWSENYASEVYKALPDNTARNINVWNPGCGKGYEAYALACILKKRYPEARIRIYAHDIDLLNVSNAPLLTLSAEDSAGWVKSFTTKTVSGEFTFIQEIKDTILFEYHDCMNTNAMPNVDIIFARDILSFLPVQLQSELVDDFSEKLKGNGIVIVGKNEQIDRNGHWLSKSYDQLTVYTKQ